MKDRRLWTLPFMFDILIYRAMRVIEIARSVGLPPELALWRYLEVDWGFTHDEARQVVTAYLQTKSFLP